MRRYTEGRIAEERRLRRIEENNHIRLCNAVVNQTHKVWESETEKTEFDRNFHEFMVGGGFHNACRNIGERMKRREALNG